MKKHVSDDILDPHVSDLFLFKVDKIMKTLILHVSTGSMASIAMLHFPLFFVLERFGGYIKRLLIR